MEAKLAIESSLEKRLFDVLQQMLNTKNIIAIVNVQLVPDSSNQSDDDVLPGVPTKDSPGAPAPLALPASMVRSTSVTIYLDRAATDADVKLAGDTVGRMLGLDPKKGDVLSVERINFQKAAPPPVAAPVSLKLPQDAFSTLWLLAAGLGLFFFGRLVGPLASALTQIVESLRSSSALRRKDVEVEYQPAAESPAGAPGSAAATPALTSEASARRIPFSFVEKRDVPTLKLILRGQKASETATVLHFLSPAAAAEILADLPTSERTEVLALMRRPTPLDHAEVTRLEESIWGKLDYFMGGEEKLMALLDGSAPILKTAILDDISRADPALGRRLSRRVVLLEDVGRLDEASFKILARHVPILNLAAAIKSSESLRESVLARLHGGTAEWLGQEIELAAELTPEVLEARINQVVSALTSLVRDGRIVLQSDRETFEASSASSAAAPEAVESREPLPPDSPSAESSGAEPLDPVLTEAPRDGASFPAFPAASAKTAGPTPPFDAELASAPVGEASAAEPPPPPLPAGDDVGLINGGHEQ